MKYFTDSPYERMMMEIPRPQKESPKKAASFYQKPFSDFQKQRKEPKHRQNKEELMNTKEMIKLLIDVEVDTEDLRLLKEHPKEHVATKREAWKLEQLFLLLENAKEMEERL